MKFLITTWHRTRYRTRHRTISSISSISSSMNKNKIRGNKINSWMMMKYYKLCKIEINKQNSNILMICLIKYRMNQYFNCIRQMMVYKINTKKINNTDCLFNN